MANNTIKVKRTSVSGRTPNTTNSGNAQYIGAGEFGLNMADRILYTSDGTNLIEIGANNTTVNISNSITVGTTTSINSSLISVGNASVNTMISSSTVNTDIFQADVAIYVGANVDILPTGLYVGNSSVNTVVNATGFYINGAAISAGPGGSATRVYQSFTATAGQNTFAVTGGYVNNYIDVFYNGVHLSNTEYTQNGTHIQLTENAIVGALVEVAGFKDISLVDYTVNTAAQYTWTNTHTFSGNLVITGVSANGSFGTAGYVLKSNGSSTYWDAGGGAASNVDSQYTWTNTHVFSNTTASGNATSGAVKISGGLGVANNIYVAGRVGFSNASNIGVAYMVYNSTANSIDTVFE